MSKELPRVFLSAGSKRTADQDRFIQALSVLLARAGFEVRQAQWSAISPLAKIKEELRSCDGAVMIGFERIYVEKGLERTAENEYRNLANLGLTTVWNHIEASMAYCLELPLLIVCEPSLREEGLLESFDWYIHRTELSADTTTDEGFLGIFQDWAQRVRNKQRSYDGDESQQQSPPRIQADSLTVGQILSSLTAVQALALGAGILGALSAAVVLGSKWPVLATLFE